MENKVGVLTPNSLKELYTPLQAQDGRWKLLFPQWLSGSLRLFSCEYHSEGDSSV